MKSRSFRPLNPIRNTVLLTITGVFLGACALIEPGTPVAALTVTAQSESDVIDVIERVFTADGFRIHSRTVDAITFEKEGSRMERVMYGNWMGGNVAERARVVVVSRGNGRYRIRVTPQMVRHPDDVGFEDVQRTAQPISLHYSHLLREVRRDFR